MKIVQQVDWRMIVVVASIIALSIYVSFRDVKTAVYPSEYVIFGDFMSGPVALLFPLMVAILAGATNLVQLNNRYVVYTRTRESIRQQVAKRFGVTCTVAFGIFAVMGIVSALMALVVVPQLYPESIDPAGYGLNSVAEVRADVMQGAPLAALLNLGKLAFSLGASAWIGLNAAIFAAVTLIATYLIGRPVVALMVPFLLYHVESLMAQLGGVPGASFIISATYPAGLRDYNPVQAFGPTVLLAVIAIVFTIYIVVSSPKNPRFS